MTSLTSAINMTLALDDLRPSDRVNTTLHQLVDCIIRPEANIEAITPTTQATIRHICGEAEGYLENYWAEKITQSSHPRRTAKKFPYWDNYVQLARQETQLLTESGLDPQEVHRILIIGSGPLPMTALHLSRHFPFAALDHVDQDPTAVRQGSALLHTLGYDAGEYLCGDGASVALQQTYDLILIAALAGETLEEKQAIVAHILPSLADDGRILIRSARGVRGLLYPVFAANDLQNVTLLAEHHPTDDTINSVFIYRKEHA